MTPNVIDTLQLDIIVNTKINGQSITTLRNSLEKLYKFLNGVNSQDLSKVSNDISKLANAVNSFNTYRVKSLNSLSNALKKIKEFTAGMATQDISSLDEKLVKVSNSLTKFVSNLNSLDQTGLKNIKTISSLSSLSSGLNKLDKTIDGLDVEKLKKKFTQMADAISPFISKVSSAREELIALNNVMGGAKALTKTATAKATTSTNTTILGGKLGKSLNFGSMIAKLYFIRNITKQLGQNLAKVVQYGIDYEETLNLWQVAMKGNTAEARKFITEMNRAYGISEITLMNYQATFKNMLSSLGGINQEVAYGLSETLSQMALDYASLYNTSIESAMTKFQAVLAGQVRPIRSESGYDITQATLYEVYKSIGGTKSVRQLSETEKRLLRILAVYRQMKDTAVGDYAKTITSTANQTRFMSETIKDIATWIGVGANQWLKQSNLLIKINAYLLALKELAKSFSFSMGYSEEKTPLQKIAQTTMKAFGAITVSEEKAVDPLADMEEGWNDINKKVDEYEEKLLGFDKFQVLTSADTGDGADISAELIKAMQEYEEILGKTQNIALFGDAEKNITGAYDILKKWGFEYNALSGQWTKDGKNVKEVVEEIAKSLQGVITLIGLFTKPWLVLAVYIEKAYLTDEQFRNSVNQLLSALSGALTNILPTFVKILESFLPVITGIINGFANVVTFLDRIGALEFVIWAIVTALIAWKTTQAAIGVIKFAQDVKNTLIPAITSAASFIKKEFIGALAALGVNLKSTMLRISSATLGIAAMGATIALAFSVFQNWDDMSGVQKLISVLGLLTTALLGAALAFGTFHSAKTMGLAVAGIAAGIIAVTASINSAKSNIESMEVTQYAKGGLADKGSLFLAGEAGPELVTQTSGGGSTIMNMKQLEDAVARGFIRGFMSTDKGDTSDNSSDVYIDGQKVFNVMRGVARRNGYDFAKV